MRKYKLFVRVLVALLACYLLFNLAVWNLFVERLLNTPGCPPGDLARMGYVTGSTVCRQPENDLPRRHLERDRYRGEPVDLVTIGDSFSNGGGGGKNRYYQDYIATLNGLSVLNIPQYRDIDRISTVSLLLNNGYLERIRPKFVMISCSEKQCLDGLPEQLDFERVIPEEELAAYRTVSYDTPPQQRQLMGFFSEANYKFVKNAILYRFSDNAYTRKVYKAQLDRPLFSAENPSTLLYFGGDLQFQKRGAAQIARLNDALNALSDRLQRKGITLYFMPCVDKYNLYSGYIVNNRHPRSAFFEELGKLPKRYRYVDTKSILLQALEEGEKDLYHADDTHWSWKASERVFRTVRFADR